MEIDCLSGSQGRQMQSMRLTSRHNRVSRTNLTRIAINEPQTI
jgi:hypothetical protein